MEVKAADTYRCELTGGFSENAMISLMELYQPLITPQGVIVYLTLSAEAKSMRTQQSHSRLFSLTSLDPGTFDRACAKLEEYMLLRVYRKSTETRNTYLYILNIPMTVKSFMTTGIYMNRYTNAMGAHQTEISLSGLRSDMLSTQGFVDITRQVMHKNITDEEENVYTAVRPRYRFSPDDNTINFDYERFIASTSTLVYPAELRSQENLALIGKLATVYGLSVDQMRILVSRCVNLETMEFNSEKLRLLAAKTEGEIRQAPDVYSLSPVSFLQAKQNGAEVTLGDKKLIEHLAMDMHFSNEVINVMLEYILGISDNRLNPRFVDMVASEWARDGIETKEQALLETKKNVGKRKNTSSNIRIDMPEYIRQQQKGTLPQEKKASRETIEAVKQMQNKMKE